MNEIPECTTCRKICTDRFNDPQVFYYDAEPFCGRCYHSMICSYCDPPTTLAKCEGHTILKNPSNRFMKDKEFVDGMRFEYESDRHLQPTARPMHVPSK